MPGDIRLRGGHTTTDPRLNRLPEKDRKSREFPTRRLLGAKADAPVSSKIWRLNLWLDQGQEGACTGFSRAHGLAAEPRALKGIDERMAHRLYQLAKVLDDYPGEEYEGSSVLGAVKAAQQMSLVHTYYWAFALSDFLHGVTDAGPAVVGCNWYSNMANTDANGFIHPTGSLTGGHAITIIGQWLDFGGDGPLGVDMDTSYVIWHNSWGRSWGQGGRAKMSMREFDQLRKEDSEVCFSRDVGGKA